MRDHHPEYPWFTPDQVRLVRTCTLSGDAGDRAWHEWSATLDLNDVDPGSQRLLPLLYRRLVDRGIEADHLDRLKGVYRRSWYDNTMLLRGAVPALNALL
ncbi:MAG: hypothetical protein AAF791_09185, partial [Bacteroidota bacterium]